MLTMYLKIAFRNLLKNKVFSFVNIFGLAIGIAASLLILNFIQFQRSYDRFHILGNRIFRVPMEVVEKGGAVQNFAFTYPAVAPNLKRDFPEVESAVRFRYSGSLAKRGDVLRDVRVAYTDASFFDIFSFPLLQGDPKTALSEPYSAVLTEKMAAQLFGQESAFGKSFTLDDHEWTVRGILQDPPINSHLTLHMLLDYPTYVQLIKARGGDAEGSWGWSDFYTYVLLRPGASPEALSAKLPDFAKRHMGDRMAADGFEQRFFLQPLRDIHLRSAYDYELEGNGNYRFIYLLGLAGLFILVIAWMNYINLATARSLERSREVGVRKAVGAGRNQLVRQFLTEALLVNALAIAGGAFLFRLALGGFARIVGRAPAELLPHNVVFWLMLTGLFLVGALLAAFYPAFVLARTNPIDALKSGGKTGAAAGKAGLRKTLVVTQFGIGMLLVTGAMALYWQMEYMRRHDLGVRIDQTLVVEERVNRDSTQRSKVRAFLTDLQALSGVQAACASTDVPGKEIGWSTSYKRLNNDLLKRCRVFGTDDKFLTQYGLQFVAGRNFTDNLAGDRQTCVLNETAVKTLGFSSPEAAVGQPILGSEPEARPRIIVGVVRDYHQEALRYPFNPTVFIPLQDDWGYYSLKVQATDMPALVGQVEKTWKKYFADAPWEFFFLDEYYENQYKLDRVFGQLLLAFTALALLVACLGLFSLSMFTVAKRTKEIGIRKVLGAQVPQIVGLVTREYFRVILLAAVLALPLAVFGVQKFLSSYAFHAELGWWFYLLPVLALLGVAVLTTIGQSWRAAEANPVKSLRNE